MDHDEVEEYRFVIRRLARLLRPVELPRVRVPGESEEAVRNPARAPDLVLIEPDTAGCRCTQNRCPPTLLTSGHGHDGSSSPRQRAAVLVEYRRVHPDGHDNLLRVLISTLIANLPCRR